MLLIIVVLLILSVSPSQSDCLHDAELFLCASGDSKVPTVTTLNLSNRGLKELHRSLLLPYQHVKSLYLHSNPLRSAENLKLFSMLPDLEYVDLTNTSLFFMNLKVFARNRKLKVVVLNDNPHMLLSPATAELPQLQELQLQNCGLTELRASSFQSFRKLSILDLRRNKIMELPSDFYRNLPFIDSILLTGNPILESSSKEISWDDASIMRATFLTGAAICVLIYFLCCRR